VKLVRFEHDGEERAGVIRAGAIVPLEFPRVSDLFTGPTEALEVLGNDGPPLPHDGIRLLAPVPVPSKLIGIGLNYRDHAEEAGLPIPDRPVVFAKYPSSLIGPERPIRIPPATEQVDYEVELAVVIGQEARDVDASDALDAVFGYMTFNDVSARDVQFANGGQWTRGKSFDTFGPAGPYLVTADEVPDPQALSLSARVNGDTLQQGSTADMIFSVAEIVAFVSAATTLLPGDVIATGTPAGVGMAQDPPRWLRPGDSVACEVEGLGALRNPVENGA
jgi:2,4-didehydro-3-deoxy-L-rhamnonate hydrolase